jgi:hypothetical protein
MASNATKYLHEEIIPLAFALLPEKMRSIEAAAMVLAIFLQESRCLYRKQLKGPARGFAQFEVNGVKGVMTHAASRGLALEILESQAYRPDVEEVQLALTDNDVLTVVFTRLLLWTHPGALPQEGEIARSWAYYLSLWRPGKPKPETWAKFYTEAWSLVKGDKHG